jgi:uncharacterized sporulation protein YeaH/YhbH (DUF444 family)
MRDVSGSMGEFEAYICRSFYFWMLRFLRTKYTNTEIVFITCHTEAKEVDEHEFFAAGDSGGTRLSAAYKLALEIIEKRYNPREWNIYPFLCSRTATTGATTRWWSWYEQMVESISNLIGYGEIADELWGSGWPSRRWDRRSPKRSPMTRAWCWSKSPPKRMCGPR